MSETASAPSRIGAIWAGDAKFEVNSSGEAAPSTLKKLVICYIAEHLGSVCNIKSEDHRTKFFREPQRRNDGNGKESRQSDSLATSLEKSKCDNEDIVFTQSVNRNSISEASGSISSISPNMIESSFSSGMCHSSSDSWMLWLPYNVFNVPNYGNVYDKTDSIKPTPDEQKRLTEVFKVNCNFKFRNSNMYLSPHSAAMLLEQLDRCGILTDSVISLFEHTSILLYQVLIHRCGVLITERGLQFLQHLSQLQRLELHNTCVHGDVLSTLLCPPARHNLTALSLRGYNPDPGSSTATGAPQRRPTVAIYSFLDQFPNLQELDVSHNPGLDASCLRHILQQLPLLWKLNISHCSRVRSIKPLTVASDRLQHFSVAGVMISSVEETILVLRTLTCLRYLDVSTVAYVMSDTQEECINEVLMDPEFAPGLEYVDLSNQTQVSQVVLRTFLQTHRHVRCVGLVNVPLCADFNKASWPRVKFLCDVVGSSQNTSDNTPPNNASNNVQQNNSGNNNPQQNNSSNNNNSDAVALRRLSDCLAHYRRWPHLVGRLLQQTSSVASAAGAGPPQPALVANILRCLETYQERSDVQVSGTSCLYVLTEGVLRQPLHPTLLRAAVHATIHAVTLYPRNCQILKNGLRLLCSNNVLHHVSFNQYWVAMIALEALHSYNDENIDLMAVGICSILAVKLTNEQTAQLGSNPAFMSKLLSLVQARIETGSADMTLQFTLSALWNLTDESPVTCEIFLHQEGLQLFSCLLNAFPDRPAVETKVLGLFNNVAEVPRLRQDLLKPDFITMIRKQLKSEHIPVSYFAAGITAHLVCADHSVWEQAGELPRKELLMELSDAVSAWESPLEEMVAYKSFQPFRPLLGATDAPAVQLWAVWALHHVTVNSAKYYCPMLIREGIPSVLERLHRTPPDGLSTASDMFPTTASTSLAPADIYSTPTGGPVLLLRRLSGQLLELVDEYRAMEARGASEPAVPPYLPRRTRGDGGHADC